MEIINNGLLSLNIEKDLSNYMYQYYNDLCIDNGEIFVTDRIDLYSNTLIRNIETIEFDGNEDWKYDEKTKSYYIKVDHKFCDKVSGKHDQILSNYFLWQKYKEPLDLYKMSCDEDNCIYFNFDDGKNGIENFKMWIRKKHGGNEKFIICFLMQNPYISNYYSYNHNPRLIPSTIDVQTTVKPSKTTGTRTIVLKNIM